MRKIINKTEKKIFFFYRYNVSSFAYMILQKAEFQHPKRPFVTLVLEHQRNIFSLTFNYCHLSFCKMRLFLKIK